MKKLSSVITLVGLTLTAGCHAHKPNKVIVVKKNHHHSKTILLDNNHKRNNYRIVHIKPKAKAVCKKHKKHWHCL